jgi:hypothetical protein
MSTATRATVEGDTLVTFSERKFSSPAGDVVVAIKDVFSRAGDDLIVERTQTTDGASVSAKAVYDKAAAPARAP